MSRQNRRLALGAMLLALALVMQSMRLFLPPFLTIFIIGSLLNALMLIAAKTAGNKAALIIAGVTPVIAFLQGQIPLLPFIPLVAAGNITYICVAGLTQYNKSLALLLAAAGKTLALYIGSCFLLDLFVLPAAFAQTVSFIFSWPQFITAVSGGAIGYFLLARLRDT